MPAFSQSIAESRIAVANYMVQSMFCRSNILYHLATDLQGVGSESGNGGTVCSLCRPGVSGPVVAVWLGKCNMDPRNREHKSTCMSIELVNAPNWTHGSKRPYMTIKSYQMLGASGLAEYCPRQ